MDQTRKVEYLEDVKVGTSTRHSGDVMTLPVAEANEHIRLGWAKCHESGEVGVRVPGARRMVVPDNTESSAG